LRYAIDVIDIAASDASEGRGAQFIRRVYAARRCAVSDGARSMRASVAVVNIGA